MALCTASPSFLRKLIDDRSWHSRSLSAAMCTSVTHFHYCGRYNMFCSPNNTHQLLLLLLLMLLLLLILIIITTIIITITITVFHSVIIFIN